MSTHRIDKVEKLLKEELSNIFLFKLRDSALGFITITKVIASPDLKRAKVYLSVFEKENRSFVLDKIKKDVKFIRSELAHRISLKFCPELDFYIDDTQDYVEKIEGLIKKIHSQSDRENDNEINTAED
ncbi:MAG: ribosome-binding factor A [Ignavibacteriales bacterium CG12_big_fil_rev_8_21_14_0_65_30_8]|nr:MAG: ribosome-binding factor A [Ignavibacteriales bacterium CG12_big_fil_rev_8_21_14_0_65_30_8]